MTVWLAKYNQRAKMFLHKNMTLGRVEPAPKTEIELKWRADENQTNKWK